MSEKRPKRIAVYPGTFDPVTFGHISLMERACQLFDELIIAVSKSAGKSPMFSFDERIEMVKQACALSEPTCNLRIIGFEGLLAELAERESAVAIIRGLRAVSDFEYEFQMALMNRKLAKDVETVFLMPSLSWVYLSSTIVKDVAKHGGNIADLVPECVVKMFEQKNNK